MAGDSGLSIAGNVTGLLTFAVAVCGAILLRVNQLRGFENEINHYKELQEWIQQVEETFRKELSGAGVHITPWRASEVADLSTKFNKTDFDPNKRRTTWPTAPTLPTRDLEANTAAQKESTSPSGMRRFIHACRKGVSLVALFLRQPINMMSVRQCNIEGDALKARVASTLLLELRQQASESQLWRKHKGELLEEIKNAVVKSVASSIASQARGDYSGVV